MSNGKYARQTQPRRRKRRTSKKATLLLTSLILVLTLFVGGTVSFLVASSGQVENTFTPSEVKCQVNEQSFNGTTKTNVTVQNTGDTTAYIRAAIVVTWKHNANGNGNVYSKAPVLNQDYTMALNTTDWVKESDGYYYYKYPVAKDDSTNPLIISCTYNGNAPEGYGLNVEILGSAIQSEPAKAVGEAWGVTISNGSVSAYSG